MTHETEREKEKEKERRQDKRREEERRDIYDIYVCVFWLASFAYTTCYKFYIHRDLAYRALGRRGYIYRYISHVLLPYIFIYLPTYIYIFFIFYVHPSMHYITSMPSNYLST